VILRPEHRLCDRHAWRGWPLYATRQPLRGGVFSFILDDYGFIQPNMKIECNGLFAMARPKAVNVKTAKGTMSQPGGNGGQDALRFFVLHLPI
jgi:hypothetical protein